MPPKHGEHVIVIEWRNSAREKRVDFVREGATRNEFVRHARSDAKSREDDKVISKLLCDLWLRSTEHWDSEPLGAARCFASCGRSRRRRRLGRRWRTIRVTRTTKRMGRRTWSCYGYRQRRPRRRRRPQRRPGASRMSSGSCPLPMTPRAVFGVSRARSCRSSPTRKRMYFSTVSSAAYSPPVTPISMAPSPLSKRDLRYLPKRRVRIIRFS